MCDDSCGKKPTPKHFSVLAGLFLFSFGAAYCLYYGRIGYMPLDSSIVFDGAWRILSGQIPFRDFTTPNAIVPLVIQAPIFKLFGITWFAYCLHAAVFNGLFCLLVFYLLRISGGALSLSFFYTLISGVIYYPPIGIPFQDQHAYFFTLVMVVLACLATRSESRVPRDWIPFLLPPIAVVAFLCKQIPTVFGVILALVILVVLERKRLFGLLRGLLAGTLVTLVSLWGLCQAFRIDYGLVKVYLFQLPAGTGVDRMAGLAVAKSTSARSIAATLANLVLHPFIRGDRSLFFPFLIVTLIFIAAVFLVGIGCVWRNRRQALETLKKSLERNLFPLFLAQALLVICSVFTMLTLNQRENGAPFMFLSMGLTQIFLQGMWRDRGSRNRAGRFGGAAIVILLSSLLLYGSSVFCVVGFDRRVNATRSAQDITIETVRHANPADMMPQGLSFLVWATPPEYEGTPRDFNDVIDFFRKNSGNFILIGDSSILYGLTGRPSASPALWFHPALTIPEPGSPFYPDFENRLLEATRRYGIKYIVLETNKKENGKNITWAGITLASFPGLERQALERGSEIAHFGPFTIIELSRSLTGSSLGWKSRRSFPASRYPLHISENRRGSGTERMKE